MFSNLAEWCNNSLFNCKLQHLAMLKHFQHCRWLSWREWLNVEIQVCWNPTSWVNAHLESKCKRFALVFLRSLSTMKSNSLISTYCSWSHVSVLWKGNTGIFYSDFIRFLWWRMHLFLCEIFNQAPNLTLLHVFLLLWVDFVVHICLLNPLITE